MCNLLVDMTAISADYKIFGKLKKIKGSISNIHIIAKIISFYDKIRF